MITRILYDLILKLVDLVLPWLAPFHGRVNLWLKGRSMQHLPVVQHGTTRVVIWMHCASLGEFEQGRPVWEAVRKQYPSAFLALTFFSPSGYERQKNFKAADWVGYLPLDTRQKAEAFVEHLGPSLVLWVKYDFWFNHLDAIQRRGIPSVLLAARFREGSWMERKWAASIRKLVLGFQRIAVQDEGSAAWAFRWSGKEAIVAGDPRVDRVLALPDEGLNDAVLEQFADDRPLVVCGSVWEKDVRLLAQAIRHPSLKGWCWLIAPHDISEERIGRMMLDLGSGVLRYSESRSVSIDARVMLLDTIGMLNRAYRLGRMAYVGGGFGRSVHNLLEPAAYGLPVIFGPQHQKFPEGAGLIQSGGGFEVKNGEDLITCLEDLQRPERLLPAGRMSRKYVVSHAGATQKILDIIQTFLPS